jgi:hypothetical protein
MHGGELDLLNFCGYRRLLYFKIASTCIKGICVSHNLKLQQCDTMQQKSERLLLFLCFPVYKNLTDKVSKNHLS